MPVSCPFCFSHPHPLTISCRDDDALPGVPRIDLMVRKSLFRYEVFRGHEKVQRGQAHIPNSPNSLCRGHFRNS